jgi:hypothetical protein
VPATSPVCHVIELHPHGPLPAARPSHLQLPRLPSDVAVRIAVLVSQRWRAVALARLVRVALDALDLPLHAGAHAVRAPSQMLRAACRGVALSVSRAPPMVVRVRARLVGKRRHCPPFVVLTPPCVFCRRCAPTW